MYTCGKNCNWAVIVWNLLQNIRQYCFPDYSLLVLVWIKPVIYQVTCNKLTEISYYGLNVWLIKPEINEIGFNELFSQQLNIKNDILLQNDSTLNWKFVDNKNKVFKKRLNIEKFLCYKVINQ